MSFGVLDVGYVPKTFDELVTELEAQFRAAFGESIDVTPQSVFGQIIQIMAERLADLWDLGGNIYASWNPDNAKGTALDYLCALTGCIRNPATYSTVSCDLTGSIGATIPTGSVATVTGTSARFALVADVTLDSSGNGTGVFQAVSSGPVIAVSGALNNIATPVFGWSTVTNSLDATLGKNLESDSTLRIRREAELSLGGTSTIEAIRASILAIVGVETCTVFDNPSDVTDDDGRPPHSFEALVGGAFDGQEVLDTIWARKPAGIKAYGEIPGTVVDDQGISQTVAYSAPSEIDVYVIANLTIDPLTWAADTGPDAIKADLIAFGDAALINGWDVVAAQLSAQCFKEAGVLDVEILIDTSPTPTTSTTIPITARQFAKLDTSRIAVNTTDGSP